MVFVRGERAGEGLLGRDEGSFEVQGEGGAWEGWDAGCDGEEVDEFEDEETGEGAAEVGYAGVLLDMVKR